MVQPAISYTERDYESVRQALFNWIKLRFPKDWPEVVETTVAVIILDIVAWTHAQRAYYYDIQARNCYLETADLPEAIMAIARQLGYTRRLATGASVRVTLYPTPAQAVPITIPKGTKIEVNDMIFEASDTYVIPANNSVWPPEDSDELIIFVEGETKTEEFISDGTAFQAYQLSHPNIIQGSITVTILDEEWESVPSLIFIEGTGHGRDTFIGDGEDEQTFKLSLLHVLIDVEDEDVIVVMVDGEKWQLVEEFTGAPREFRVTQEIDGETTVRFGYGMDGSAPPDTSVVDVLYQIMGAQKRYVVDLGKSGTATIRFGDSQSGLVPPDGSSIVISYRIGGGVKGNIRRADMDSSVRGLLPSSGEINVRVFNHEGGSGGEPIESLERVKFVAPKYAQTNQRAVTNEDFTILALTYSDPRYGAPAFASAKLKQRVPELNLVQIALWSRDNLGRIHTATTPLKQGVKSHIDARRTICTYVEIVDGDIIYFDVHAKILLNGGRTISSILEPITAILREHFNSTFVTPGVDLSLALIVDRILSVPHVDLTTIVKVEGSRLQELDLGQGDGINKDFVETFSVPDGVSIVPESFELTDGTQTINDNGEGRLVGDIDDTDPTLNYINYTTGKFVAKFVTAPADTTFVTAEARVIAHMGNTKTQVLVENRIDGITDFTPIVQRRPLGYADGLNVNVLLPSEFLPYTPNRVVFIGGWDDFATQPGGQLLAFDDGEGNMTGDVAPGGTINYDTGHAQFTWNTMPPPVTTTDYWGYLLTEPDGVQKEFEFYVKTAPANGGSFVNLETLEMRGRIKYVLSDLSTVNVTFKDAWDNGQGIIDSESLDRSEQNTITYEDPGLLYTKGVLTFEVAPEPASGRDFRIQTTPVTLFLYTPWAAYLKGSSGYDKYLFVDNNGRIYGNVAEAYPYAFVDFLSGRYKAGLPFPDETGRRMTITYDSPVASDNIDIPISHLTMPTFSRAILIEMSREINI